MIKAIIFDCYGVLLGQGFEHTYAAAGGDIEADTDFIHEQLSTMNRGEQSVEEFDRHIAERLRIPLETWQSMKFRQELPSVHLLNFIKNELKPKYKIGMISNGSTRSIERRLSAEQLALFDFKAISAELGLLKPDPEIYKHTARNLGAELEECVFVDDYPEYVKAAEALGMQGVVYVRFKDFKNVLNDVLSKK